MNRIILILTIGFAIIFAQTTTNGGTQYESKKLSVKSRVGNPVYQLKHDSEPNMKQTAPQEDFTVDISKITKVEVFDISGKMLLQSDYQVYTRELKSLRSGVYLVRFNSGEKKITKKIVNMR